mgnify:FL=1
MTDGEGQPSKVLHIIARMNVGGPAWQVSVLMRGLEGGYFENLLVVGAVGSGEADFLELRDPGLPARRVSGLGKSLRPFNDLRAFGSICRVMRQYRPDIVHTHTAKAGFLGRVAAVVCRIPLRVHTYHGHVLQGYFKPPVLRLVVIAERLLAVASTALVAVGERVRDDLLDAGIGCLDQYTVIPPGVEIGHLIERSSARSHLGLPAGAPVIVFVGRLTRIKRPDRLVATMTLVLERLPDAILVIAGEGERLEETQRYAEPLGDSVRFLGWRSDLSTVYAAADCAVLTSDNEGMPVTLLEAAAAGIPSVTTAVGSASEVVIDGVTGFVVEPDASALAEALVRLLANGSRAEMGAEARRRAESMFRTQRLVDDHRLLYERLLARLEQTNPK